MQVCSKLKMHQKFVVYCLSVLWWGVCDGWQGRVVFEDNFDGSSLDLKKWEYQEGCGTEYGSGNLQCYSRDNVKVSGGKLTIEARPQRKKDKQYTSGRIRQRGSGFTYGAYVMKARMPKGDHLWAALWMLPINNNCRYEEIDIAEFRGQPSEVKNVEMAAHWGRSWDALSSNGTKVLTNMDLSGGFHEYAVLWLKTKLEFYIDTVKRFEVSLNDGYFTKDPNKLPCRGSNQPFDEPSNFIFNLAVGGPFFKGWPPMNPKTWSKPTFEIDWVRVYQG